MLKRFLTPKSKKFLQRKFSVPKTQKILELTLEKKQIDYNKKKLLSAFGLIYGCSGIAFYLEAIYPAFGIACFGFLYTLNSSKNPIFKSLITDIEKTEEEIYIFKTKNETIEVKREEITPLTLDYNDAMDVLESKREIIENEETNTISLTKESSILGILDDYWENYKISYRGFRAAKELDGIDRRGEREITMPREIKQLEMKVKYERNKFDKSHENFGYFLKLGNRGLYYIGFTYSNFVNVDYELLREVLAGYEVEEEEKKQIEAEVKETEDIKELK